jgi:hypothetical protein
MSLIVERFLMCDGACGENFGVDDAQQSAETQRKRARENGWTFKGGKDFCPVCSIPVAGEGGKG